MLEEELSEKELEDEVRSHLEIRSGGHPRADWQRECGWPLSCEDGDSQEGDRHPPGSRGDAVADHANLLG